mmetsp:Transcript_49953/g.119186  ORF Transcript_49953/g.119186 Transcript_49953/m.119186 type:complete len:210 (-) Transcript_49953:248-877(-)
MDQRNTVHDLRAKQFSKLPISRNLLLHVTDSTFLALLRIEGILGVVFPQCLAQLQLSRRVPLARVAKPLLRPRDEFPETSLELLEVQEITKSQTVSDCLRRVAWANPALRGANGIGALLRLEDAIDDLVAVKEDVGTCRNEHPLECSRVEFLQLLQLPHKRGDVDHDTVSNEVLASLVDHSTRKKMKGILLSIHKQSVSSIRSAVKACT